MVFVSTEEISSPPFKGRLHIGLLDTSCISRASIHRSSGTNRNLWLVSKQRSVRLRTCGCRFAAVSQTSPSGMPPSQV